MSGGWSRVASGFRLVMSSATTQAMKESMEAASNASKHGIDLTNNLRNVAASASVSSSFDTSTFSTLNVLSSSISSDHVDQEYNEQKVTDSAPMNHAKSLTNNSSKEQNQDIQHSTNNSATKTRTNKSSKSIYQVLKEHHSNTNSNTQSNTNTTEQMINHSTENNIQNSTTQNLPIHNHNAHTNTTNTINNINTTQSNSFVSPSYDTYTNNNNNNQTMKEGQAVPSTRIGRAAGFASLGIRLIAGTAWEAISQVVTDTPNNKTTTTSSSAIVANDANADRLARTLCRMRGAALKLGQMLSIQDETLLPSPLAKALEQVRQGADAMPKYQLQQQLVQEYGEDWRDKFISFDDAPFAAASIGQVHRATISSPSSNVVQQHPKKVVVKVQYPGVAESIESDLRNLSMLVSMTGMAPPGLFIEEVIRVGREELKVECDYIREMKFQKRLKQLVQSDFELTHDAKFVVPDVIEELTTSRIIVTEYCPGGTIEKVSHLDQQERNRIARNILKLTMKELFTWRFMQTDPNWGNFLYDMGTGITYLIDFGSAREFDKSFVDGYLRIVWAAANRDSDTLMSQSHTMGFLTGDENEIMLEAHKMSGFTIGEPFATNEIYDFASSGITGRISHHGSVFLQHRLTPPPSEVYSLHRKLAGAFNLCIKLGAKIRCRDLLEDVIQNHEFQDGLGTDSIHKFLHSR